jgi:flagellar protein FliO/FliZ
MSGSVITAGSMFQSLLGLLLVLAMIAGAAWLLKRFSVQPGSGGGAIKVIAGAAVGQRERVVLVEVGGTWLLVGVAPGQVRALHTMPKAELELRTQLAPAAERNFAGWLRQVMEKRNGTA